LDLFIADIHADIDALDTILNVASSKEFTKKYGTFSRIINLGDILERGTHPKQVIAKLRSLEKNYPIFSVMGNHDEAFLYDKKVSGSSFESMDAHSRINDDDISFFGKNKDGTFGKQEFIDKKHGLFCVHGGPLDPKKIMPKKTLNESWLYQKTWQRLTEEDFEFFSYYGYHYKPSSAFAEVKNHFKNHIILCGHQHLEAAIIEDDQIHEIYSSLRPTKEKTSDHTLEAREIEINPVSNYLIRLGLGGPQGYYGNSPTVPHFAIVQYNPKKVILFTVNP